ncbi:MAG: LytTR family transcriptional regulator DNA-binding domain-containing protein [Prevotella sp.]|nr:LytTR family transcriptional regulator DNA-binding domain-containing protein [Prevotella sp.]
MKVLRSVFFVGLALCLCLHTQAQMESRLTYRRYTAQDGLPQMQAERLWQDSRGYIYIGTLSGFVRYDGRAFTPFLKGRRLNIVGFTEVGESNNRGHGTHEVRALGFFSQWVVKQDDVRPLPLDPQGHWLLNNLNAGSLPEGYVLLEDSLEQNRRLCRMTKKGMEPVMTHKLLDEMTPDRKLYYDVKNGEAIVPLDKGVYRIVKSSEKPVRLSEKGDVYTLLRTDSTLLAFASDGIYAIGGKGLRRLMEADWTATSYGLSVRTLRSGAWVVVDEHSVYVCEDGHARQIATGINLIRDVMVDRWDRLWVATYQGVYCFFNRGFTNHRLTDENDIVRAVGVDNAGGLALGTLNGKVMNLSESCVLQLVDDNPEQFYAPSTAKVGNEVYLAGNGDVACVVDDGDGKVSLRWLGLPRDRYQFVAAAWERLIVGSRTGIFAYDPETGHVDTLTTAILHPWCAAQGGDGRLWVGSSSGLFSVNKSLEISKMEYQGQKLVVTALEADPWGGIVFASADSLFVVRDGKVETLNRLMPQLCGHEVRALHVSPRGFLSVAVVDGLFVCRIGQDYGLSDIHFFDHRNGFTMTEPLKAMMAETADGTLWLPGVEEMTSFRPEELLAYSEEDTYIRLPLRWWQHWWVWLTGILLMTVMVWAATRRYEKRRNRQGMIRLQREKMQCEEQIKAIRQKAIDAEPNDLAKDIVKMTERTYEERLTLRTASGTIVAEMKDIAYIKADGNYSQIVTFHGTDIVLMGLGALERMLSPDMFVRADRSTLVSIHHVCHLLPKQRRCIFRSPSGQEVETTLLAPAFKRLQDLL